MIEMETILFHSNILSQDDVPFINEVSGHLKKSGLSLVLTGWNTILPEWNLTTTYLKLPEQLDFFIDVFKEDDINLDFEKYKLSSVFLVERFNWWFPSPKDESEKLRRLSFLHFHLHHYLKLIKQYNPSLLLIWNGNDPRQYIIGKLGVFFGIKTLFVERGPLPAVLFYDKKGGLFNSSVSSLSLDKFKNGFENYNHVEEYVKWYSSTSETLWHQPTSLQNNNLRERFGINENQKITIFIGQVDNDVQTKLFSPFFASNLEAFEWFVKHAIKENHFVIGKHHPKSLIPVEKYQSIIGELQNVIWTNQLALNECLEVADFIVAVNSSVIFDALLHKKPVLSLGESILSNKGILYECNPNNFEKGLKEFYCLLNFENKLVNFKNILEFLFKENLIFIKNKLNSKIFAQKLISLKESKNNLNDVFEHNQVLEKYTSNDLKLERDYYTRMILKIRKRIKWYFARIFLEK